MQVSVPKRKPLLLISVSSFALALMTLSIAMFYFWKLNSTTTFAGAYLGLMALLIIQLVVGRMWLRALAPDCGSWLHPPFLITVWVLLYMGVPALYSLLRPDILIPLELISIDPFYTVLGTWLIVIGCLVLWIGYGVSYRIWKDPPLLRRLAEHQPKQSVVLILFGTTVLLQLTQIVVTGIAYGADTSRLGALAPFQQWLSYFQDLNRLVLAFIALKSFQREWPSWILVAVAVSQLGFGFVSGFMKPIIWIALILLMAALVAKINLRRLAVPIAFFIVLGLLTVPVAEDLRSRANASALDTTDLVEVANATTDSVVAAWSSGAGDNWQQTFDRTMYRNAVVASTPGIIMQKTPSLIPYQGIERFLAIPAYVIPRALWRDKPVLSRGNWFAIVYLNQPDFLKSSAAITIFGEGYMYAGWIGMMLACLILGLLLAGIYRITAGVGLWAIYIALVPTFMDVEGQFTDMLVALVQRMVVFVLAYWLMVRLSNPRRSSSTFGVPRQSSAQKLTRRSSSILHK